MGGAVPIHGGIVLSVARMNQIKEINPEDGVIVEPGVITGELQERVKELGYFIRPIQPVSKSVVLEETLPLMRVDLGSLKYGVTRHYVLGIEVVLSDGFIVRLGEDATRTKRVLI